ncbi:hypothetical protein AAC387_Pa03g1140 [Persea americana]
MAWKTITQSVVDGGLGIRDITAQNKAAMAKLVWYFLNDKQNWWSQMLRHKYLNQTSFEHYTPQQTDSPLWMAMLKIKKVSTDNQKWVVGDGEMVSALDDVWGVCRLRQHFLF